MPSSNRLSQNESISSSIESVSYNPKSNKITIISQNDVFEIEISNLNSVSNQIGSLQTTRSAFSGILANQGLNLSRLSFDINNLKEQTNVQQNILDSLFATNISTASSVSNKLNDVTIETDNISGISTLIFKRPNESNLNVILPSFGGVLKDVVLNNNDQLQFTTSNGSALLPINLPIGNLLNNCILNSNNQLVFETQNGNALFPITLPTVNNTDISPNNCFIQGDGLLKFESHGGTINMTDGIWIRINKDIFANSKKITTNHRIGAGTSNPGYTFHCNGKLHGSQGGFISGSWQTKDYSNSAADWWQKNKGYIEANPPNRNIGLHVDKCIECEAYIVTSDSRIKKNIKDIDDTKALDQLRLIKPKTYEYIDSYNKNRGEVIGFIAQEIKEVIPRAVELTRKCIPNVLKSVKIVSIKNDIICLELFEPFDEVLLRKGDSIEINLNDNKHEVILEDITNDKVFIKIPDLLKDVDGNCQAKIGDRGLIQGQIVDDFHLLDKNAIFTITTAAVQELDRQLQLEKKKTLRLEQQMKEILLKINETD